MPKKPVEVVIVLDILADEVHAIYREFWELKGMYKLAQNTKKPNTIFVPS
jgi:hypothetical protein